MNPALTLVFGAMVGVGLVIVMAGLLPAPPDLHAALDRLNPTRVLEPTETPTVTHGPRWLAERIDRLLPRVVQRLGLERFAADLRLIDRTPEQLAARKVVYVALGLGFPAAITGLLALVGVRLPFAVPAAVSILLAGLLFLAPDADVRRRAAAARLSMRRAAGVFLELVALERAADAGTTEALDRAASIGTSREFDRIRDALLRAELTGRPAWAGLTTLAETTGVVELGDVADIMRLSAADGAAVYTTLRARAASLRTQLLTTATAEANAASEHMIVPVALLGVTFMVLIGYPAFSRILFG